MSPCFLLLFLPSVLGCNTAIALPGYVLSVARSQKCNADVALLNFYLAKDVNTCIQECCIEKYGSCTVVSFHKNETKKNCHHFNCRPVKKCKYLSSNSTDSFSFSSSPLPNRNTSIPSSLSRTTTPAASLTVKYEPKITGEIPVDLLNEQQFVMKSTSIKPRKGVEFSDENITKSSIKARKGVIIENTRSNVKPRKGVNETMLLKSSAYELSQSDFHFSKVGSSVLTDASKYGTADDLVPVLEKMLEDDIQSTNSYNETGVKSTTYFQTSAVTTSVLDSFSAVTDLQSSFSKSRVAAASTSAQTPHLLYTSNAQNAQTAASLIYIEAATTVAPTIFDHSRKIFGSDERVKTETDEEVKDRKYKSSMHLVLSLVFGLIVLFSVLGVVAKRMYDGWSYRHYRRMDFLIEGMYNGS